MQGSAEEEVYGAGRAFGGDEAVLTSEPVRGLVAVRAADSVLREAAIFGDAVEVFVGWDHAELVCTGDEHGGAVEFSHIV